MPMLGTLGTLSPNQLGRGFGPASLDPFFNNVTLLISAEGVNNGRNNTYTNQVGPSPFTGLGQNLHTQGSFSPYAPGFSVYIDGTSTISAPAGLITAFAGWGGRRRSWDCWIYRGHTGSCVLVKAYQAVEANGRWYILCNSTNRLQFGWTTSTGSETSVQTTATIPTGWTFLSVCVDSLTSTNTTIYLGIDGQVQTFTANNLSTQTSSYTWDAFFNTSQFLPARFDGYFSGMRFSDNLRYTSNFTPPAAPQVNDANTLFLYGQNGRNNFRDESSNAYSVTINGTWPTVPSYQPFSPFNVSGFYSANTVGGSVHLSLGHLAITGNTAFDITQGDFTLEVWVYSQIASVRTTFLCLRNNVNSAGWILERLADNTVQFAQAGVSAANGTITSTTTMSTQTWVHIAVQRSGSTARLFINGSAVLGNTNSTFTNGVTPSFAEADFLVGRNNGATTTYRGYITGIRIIKSQALATSTSFTLPTQPVSNSFVGWSGSVASSITGTVTFLTNFINGNIIDLAGKHTFNTFGAVQTSTTLSRFGGSSLAFNSGAYMRCVGLPTGSFNFRTGPFTIELWLYVGSISGTQTILDTNTLSDSTGTGRLLLRIETNGNISVRTGTSSLITSGGSITINTWHHVAVARDSSSVMRIYQNGAQVNVNTTSTVNFSMKADSRPVFGVNGFDEASDPFAGYMDEIRITNNLARYTIISFSVPTSAFPRRRS